MINKNYKKCSCEHCNRDTNNWKGRFRRYNDNWYCDKHYTQLRRHNEITDNKKKIDLIMNVIVSGAIEILKIFKVDFVVLIINGIV